MRRREFITLLGGAAAAWPVLARGQQAGRVRRIGFVLTLTRDNPDGQSRFTAFRRGLETYGWNADNIRIDERWPGEDSQKLRVAAAELVGLNPDVILVGGSRAMHVLQQQTSVIPIVFVAAAGTIEHGIVTNVARPSGNLTGFTTYDSFVLAGKLLGTLKEAFPRLARAHPSIVGYRNQLAASAAILGVKPSLALATGAAEIEHAIGDFSREPDGGLVLPPDQFNILHRDLIIELAARHRVPSIYGYRSHAAAGGLMSYGTDITSLYQHAAGYVDRLLKGEKPSDLPVQAPTKYELVINLKTAKALGLTIPPVLLARADEVIE